MKKSIEKFAMEIPGWLTISEGKFLEKIAKKTENLNGVMVEIGSFHGKSTIFLAQSKGKLYSVDPHKGEVGPDLTFPGTFNSFLRNVKKAGVNKKIVSVVKTSKTANKSWKEGIRLLFIDGLHDKKNAELDFELWQKHLVNGGIIAIHDSYLKWCGSETVAINRIVRSNQFYKIGFKDSITYGIKGKGSNLNKITKMLIQIYMISSVLINRMVDVTINLGKVIKKAKLTTAFSIFFI